MSREVDVAIAGLTVEVAHLREATSALASTTVERARFDERDRALSAVLADMSKSIDQFDARLDALERSSAAGATRFGFAGTVIAAALAAFTTWLASRR